MDELVHIGKSVPRVDAQEKVAGRALFTVDVVFPHMLIARVLRSNLAHARILNIDTSRAEKLPGVKAIITGRDSTIPIMGVINDQCILATDTVRYAGEGVAAVAAVDEPVAEEALELIKVDYEELPGVFDPEEAMKPDAPLVHPRLGEYSSVPGFAPVPPQVLHRSVRGTSILALMPWAACSRVSSRSYRRSVPRAGPLGLPPNPRKRVSKRSPNPPNPDPRSLKISSKLAPRKMSSAVYRPAIPAWPNRSY